MKNVYIGYVSDSNRLNDDGFEYVSDIDNIKICAKTANESCLKYVIKKLEGKNERLDKIIFLCTPQVKEHKITEYLKNSTEQLSECTIVEIDTHMDLDVYTEIPKILNHIDDSDRLYMDMTGGIRAATIPLMLVSYYLQRRGNEIAGEIYSTLDNGKKSGSIKSNTTNRDIIRLISGIDEFATSAKVGTLQSVLSDEQDPDIINLLDSMKSFSESIILGQTNLVDENLLNLNNAISALQNKTDSLDARVALMQSMLPVIKNKFFYTDKNEINTVSTIRWCVDNGFLQQALTLYTEKMPDVIMNNNWLEYTGDKSKIKHQSFESINYCILYRELIQSPKMLRTPQATQIADPISLFRSIITPVGECDSDIFKKAKIRNAKKSYPEFTKAIEVMEELDNKCGDLVTLRRKVQTQRVRCYSKDKKIQEIWNDALKTTFRNVWQCTANDFITHVLEAAGILYEASDKDPGEDEPNRFESQCSCIDSMTDTWNENMEFVSHIDLDVLKHILIHYCCMKNLRNKINHANDYGSITDTTKDILLKYGLSTSFTFDDISKDIITSTDYIESKL